MNPFKATILIAGFTILSKILGAVRQAVLANRFGAGQEVDIYVAAFRVPDLLFNLLIAGTLSVAFIPVFVEYLRKDAEEAAKVSSTIFNFTLIVMGLLVLLGAFLGPVLTRILVPGFSETARAQTAELTRILMLSPLFFSLSSILGSVLHSFKKFTAVAAAPLLYNFSIIAGIIWFYPVLGLPGLAWGVVLGAFLHFALQFPFAWRLGLRPLRWWNLYHPAIRKIGRLFLPRIFGIDLGQISFLAVSVIASFLPAGNLAVFYFAFDLETVPIGVFAMSFAIAAFPSLAEAASKKELGQFKDLLAKTMVQVLYVIVPVSLLILFLRAQIVRLILGAGEGTQFSFTDTKLTAQTLGLFALSLFAQSLIPLLARGFYAMQNTVLPVISGLFAGGVNIFLTWVLGPRFGPTGFALAFSIASVMHMLVILLLLHKKLGDLRDEFLISRLSKIILASGVTGIAAYLTLQMIAPLVNMQSYWGIAVQTLGALAAGIGAYLFTGNFIKLPETRLVLKIFQKWILKLSKIFPWPEI